MYSLVSNETTPATVLVIDLGHLVVTKPTPARIVPVEPGPEADVDAALYRDESYVDEDAFMTPPESPVPDDIHNAVCVSDVAPIAIENEAPRRDTSGFNDSLDPNKTNADVRTEAAQHVDITLSDVQVSSFS